LRWFFFLTPFALSGKSFTGALHWGQTSALDFHNPALYNDSASDGHTVHYHQVQRSASSLFTVPGTLSSMPAPAGENNERDLAIADPFITPSIRFEPHRGGAG
jgi:hypothetical protein